MSNDTPKTPRLTARQSQTLSLIQQCMQDGQSPTYADLGGALGVSDMAAYKLVAQLRRHGYVQASDGSHRGIRLVDTPEPGLAVVGRVAAGSPILAPDNIDSYLDVPPSLFRPGADYLYEVSGYSMKDVGILPGDYVGVHVQSMAENGQIVVARVVNGSTGEDEITLKRFFRESRRVLLKPENADFEPIVIDFSDESDSQERHSISIEGIYCGLIRRSEGYQ